MTTALTSTPEVFTQEPVILREILAEMDDARIRALLDACSPATTPLAPWVEEQTSLVGIEDDDPQPVDEAVEEEPTP